MIKNDPEKTTDWFILTFCILLFLCSFLLFCLPMPPSVYKAQPAGTSMTSTHLTKHQDPQRDLTSHNQGLTPSYWLVCGNWDNIQYPSWLKIQLTSFWQISSLSFQIKNTMDSHVVRLNIPGSSRDRKTNHVNQRTSARITFTHLIGEMWRANWPMAVNHHSKRKILVLKIYPAAQKKYEGHKYQENSCMDVGLLTCKDKTRMHLDFSSRTTSKTSPTKISSPWGTSPRWRHTSWHNAVRL